jgi:hypothetical protein
VLCCAVLRPFWCRFTACEACVGLGCGGSSSTGVSSRWRQLLGTCKLQVTVCVVGLLLAASVVVVVMVMLCSCAQGAFCCFLVPAVCTLCCVGWEWCCCSRCRGSLLQQQGSLWLCTAWVNKGVTVLLAVVLWHRR